VIDLHTHSILSDGALLPFELVRRAAAAGYRALAITDHVDASNIDFVVPGLVRAIEELRAHCPIGVIAGAEITHAPPALVGGLVRRARELGAALVLVHGETLAEPVEPGTNRAGIVSGADILAHPGLITEEDALLAKERGVALEITARKGHSLANGHVARTALKHGALLVINTDAHEPSDLITAEAARQVLAGAGLEDDMVEKVFGTCKKIADKTLGRDNA
jgi:histidinol phosphatase-like PHP family hydrolase